MSIGRNHKPSFYRIGIGHSRIEGIIRGTLISLAHHTNTLYIFIAGSGPTDRNSNQLGMTNNAYIKACKSFAEIGIATFRYDKRGIGKSHFPTLNEETLTIDHYVEDVIWIAQYFKYRCHEMNIGLIGHSEGGLIALLAATKMEVENLVLLATPEGVLMMSYWNKFSDARLCFMMKKAISSLA